MSISHMGTKVSKMRNWLGDVIDTVKKLVALCIRETLAVKDLQKVNKTYPKTLSYVMQALSSVQVEGCPIASRNDYEIIARTKDAEIMRTALVNVVKEIQEKIGHIYVTYKDADPIVLVSYARAMKIAYELLAKTMEVNELKGAPNHRVWLYIKIAEAKDLRAMDLRGTSDPYCRIMVDGKKIFRTKTIKKNCNPVWLQEYHFQVDNHAQTLMLRVYDKDRIGTDDFIGEKTFTMKVLSNKEEKTDGWYTLKPKTQGHVQTLRYKKNNKRDLGKIRVTVEYTEAYVLPNNLYSMLFDVCIGDSTVPKLIDSIIKGPGAKKASIKSFIAALHHKGNAVEVIEQLVCEEIANTRTTDVIFRSNSIAAICFEALINLIGYDMLRVIQPLILELCRTECSCEVDPNVLGDKAKKNLSRNKKRLIKHLKTFWKAISKAPFVVPQPIKQILAVIQTKVREKWPSDESAMYSASSGFIFLRFFCPAILGPSLYGIMEDRPSDMNNRNLTLLSKAMMGFANLKLFGAKEPFMKFVNDFIEKNRNSVIDYLDTIADGTKGPKPTMRIRGKKVQYGEVMSHVQSVLFDNLEAIGNLSRGNARIAQVKAQVERLEYVTRA